jgi:hypothetical protein
VRPPRGSRSVRASLRGVSTDYEPYVQDPAEPPARRHLARLAPALWAILLVVLVIGLTSVYWIGRGEEDPALTVPSSSEEG